MHGLKYIFDLFEIKHTDFFYTCVFDVQYTIVSGTGGSFSTSNLIRAEFVYRYHGNIDFPKKIYYFKPQSNSNIWCKFHIDSSPGSLLNGQTKMFGMVQKKL